MTTDIGATLREARIRRRVDLAEVEAATKIRVRYLRALENEEWDVLPGGAYTRSFIRTYAAFLGLDGERLADEFRRTVEDPIGERYPRADPVPVAARRGTGPAGGGRARLQVSRGALAALISIGLIVLLIGIGLAGEGGDGDDERAPGVGNAEPRGEGRGQPGERAEPQGLTVRLDALADVWVCLLDAKGRSVLDGQTLPAGAVEGPFRSAGFTVAFGNGQVEMRVNGRQVDVEDTPNPVGYAIARGGELTPLAEDERPDCL